MVFILPETFAAEVVDVVVVDVVVVVVAASISLIHTTPYNITCVVGRSWSWGRKARKGKLKRCNKLIRIL